MKMNNFGLKSNRNSNLKYRAIRIESLQRRDLMTGDVMLAAEMVSSSSLPEMEVIAEAGHEFEADVKNEGQILLDILPSKVDYPLDRVPLLCQADDCEQNSSDDDGTHVDCSDDSSEPEITLDHGTLRIHGTDSGEQITISEDLRLERGLDPDDPGDLYEIIIVEIKDECGNVTRAQFRKDQIRSLSIRANGGDDVVTNDTNIPSAMSLGRGNDTAYGGSSGDSISGDEGDDNLYGRGGPDFLYGGVDNDGLFGGEGTNTLHGSVGKDRYLIHNENGVADDDRILGLDPEDAQVNFAPGVDTTKRIHGRDVLVGPDEFTEEEIERIDQALATLHHQSIDLLKQDNGSPITFHRYGLDEWHTALNNNRGTISLFDNAFKNDDWLNQTVFHEVGHNFDNENSNWAQWKGLSGWQKIGDTWIHDQQAQFARSYGSTNPREDFATFFAHYMMDKAGLTFSGNGSIDPAKTSFMNQFIAGLS